MNAVDTIVRYLQKYMVRTVVLECGHIYVSETPDSDHKKGFSLGGDLSLRLQENSIGVKRVLFVDDYNPKVWSLDLGSYRELARSFGYPIDITVTESSMAALAHDVLEQLRRQRMVTNGGGTLNLAGSTIRLNGEGVEYSCSLIESALYLWKFKLADFCVTVLPYEYKTQQQAALKIVKMLGFQYPPCVVVYTKEDSEPIVAIHGVNH